MLVGIRVTLRALEREDLPLLCAFNNDLVVELAGGGDPPMPQSLARLEAVFADQVSQGERDGAAFAMEADGKLIGHCALFGFDATAHTCELGITIGDKAYWGRGYGREAIMLLVEYAFRHRNQHKVHLKVHAANQRAIVAYAACGFREEGRQREHVWSDGRYDDLVLMGILRREWDGIRTDQAAQQDFSEG